MAEYPCRTIDGVGSMFEKSMSVTMLILAGCCLCAGAPIKIGWGRRSINPGKPVAITGQHYLRVSLGEYNPVSTNALAIENGKDAVIFVSTDVSGYSGGTLKRVQAKLREAAPDIPADKLLMNSTHTHAGPSFSNMTPAVKGMSYMPTQEFLDFLARQIADAVIDAWKTRKPGSIAYGYGFATSGHSRRAVYLRPDPPDTSAPGADVSGHARMYGRTDDKYFSHYEAGTDAFINFLYTFDEAGKLTGACRNLPCPAQTNETAWELHAGFWAPIREKLRAEYGDIGIIGQCAAAGDLSPRQLHYRAAERRRYLLKYPEKCKEYMAHPLRYPEGFIPPEKRAARMEKDMIDMMRSEDIANRVVSAFDEVLSWAGNEKFSTPELAHQVRDVQLLRRVVTDEEFKKARADYDILLERKRKLEAGTAPEPSDLTLASRIRRCEGIFWRYNYEKKHPTIETTIHAVRLGDIAFVSSRFELFIDYMHRIQGRSPFTQTFVVQLTADPEMEHGTYLATERAAANRGYSAVLFSNFVSPQGGQQMVELMLEMLNSMR